MKIIKIKGTVNAVCNFIESSAKWHQIFKNAQLSAQAKTLKLHSETRWSSRKNSIQSLFTTYEFVLDALYFIDSIDKTSIAMSLKNLLREFEFQFVLRVLFLVYEITGFITEALQNKGSCTTRNGSCTKT